MITVCLCSDEGHPAPPTNCDIGCDEKIRAFRSTGDGAKRAYTSFKPEWLDMTIKDALQLRKALNKALRGRR